jgi:ABC-type nitrate/sulfonate/bicarbonate transport system substrate-binding protein
VRYGLQRGALGALKITLPQIEAKYNLKYDVKIFNDATAVILAMDQKELEMGNITAQHVIRAIDEGMQLVVVAGWGGGYNVLVAGPDVKTPTGDLKALKALIDERRNSGKRLKIGVPTGSQQHLKLSYLLTGMGVNPDKDVDIVNIPFPNHPRALDGKEVDMTMTLAPFAAIAINAGYGRMVYHVYGGGSGNWEIGYAVRRDLIDKNPDLVQRIVSSHVEALKSFMTDIPKQVELELKDTNFPRPVIEAVQRDYLKLSYRIALDDLRRTAKQMYDLGWAKKDHSADLEKYVDFRFLEKATGESRAQLAKF